ncbi:UNVERIFIED_CONTAM: hypothetical protein FKN15_074401 [Acipenser sinensis]
MLMEQTVSEDGIEPMWEDRRNKCGGRWLITLSKQQRHTELDRFWLETLLCIIGESFDDYSDDVCGAVINVRAKGDKIAVWTTNTENREAVTYIGMNSELDTVFIQSKSLLGASFLAIGLWAWAEKGVLSNISSITDLGGFDPVWLFMVVGAVMFILGFAGCIGALRENTHLLKFFSVFLGLIFFLELTAGILAFVFKDWIKDQLNFFINNNVKAYRDDIDLQNLIDFAQEYWSCCGAHGPNDWNLNIYFNCTDMNPSRERCGVPFSCCVKDPAEDVLNTQCGYDVRLKMWSCCGAHGPNDWNLNIYFNCTDMNPSRERCGVPFSCCVKDPAEDVLNTQCGYDVRLKMDVVDPSPLNSIAVPAELA